MFLCLCQNHSTILRQQTLNQSCHSALSFKTELRQKRVTYTCKNIFEKQIMLWFSQVFIFQVFKELKVSIKLISFLGTSNEKLEVENFKVTCIIPTKKTIKSAKINIKSICKTYNLKTRNTNERHQCRYK